MVFSAVFGGVALWCLLIGRISPVVCWVVSIGVSGCVGALGVLFHSHAMPEVGAVGSALRRVDGLCRFWGCMSLLLLSALSTAPFFGVTLAVILLGALPALGRLPLRSVCAWMSAPLLFLSVSGLTLLWEFSDTASGVLSLPFFHGYLVVTAAAQATAALVLSRALGGAACLCCFALTTPMHETIDLLKRFHVPSVMIELMYCIYRYLCLLLELHRHMKNAAQSRLGYDGLVRGLHTTGALYACLLARSLQRAGDSFRAMESRCWEGEVRFLTERTRPSVRQWACLVLLLLACAGLAFWPV